MVTADFLAWQRMDGDIELPAASAKLKRALRPGPDLSMIHAAPARNHSVPVGRWTTCLAIERSFDHSAGQGSVLMGAPLQR